MTYVWLSLAVVALCSFMSALAARSMHGTARTGAMMAALWPVTFPAAAIDWLWRRCVHWHSPLGLLARVDETHDLWFYGVGRGQWGIGVVVRRTRSEDPS